MASEKDAEPLASGSKVSADETVALPDLQIEEIPAPTLESAQRLLAHYSSLAPDGATPTRDDLDPLDVPSDLLPFLYLLEPYEDYSDWVYRLIGSAIVDRFQVDRTGQNIRSFVPEARADILIKNSNHVVAVGAPMCFRLKPYGTVMEYFYAETMSLPLADQNTGKTWLFGGTFFGSATAD